MNVASRGRIQVQVIIDLAGKSFRPDGVSFALLIGLFRGSCDIGGAKGERTAGGTYSFMHTALLTNHHARGALRLCKKTFVCCSAIPGTSFSKLRGIR